MTAAAKLIAVGYLAWSVLSDVALLALVACGSGCSWDADELV